MAEFRKVTVHIPVEVWTEDPDGDIGKLREIAGAVNEVVAEYVEATIGISIAATGEASVTDGWGPQLELGIPYAATDPDSGERVCPVCEARFAEDHDAAGELTSDNYGDHYRQWHAGGA